MTYTPPGGAPTGKRDLDSLSPREKAEYFCRFMHLPLTPENIRAFERDPNQAPVPDPERCDPDDLDAMVPPELRKRRAIFLPGWSR